MIIITTYNRPELLNNLLECISNAQLKNGTEQEVIIIDDGSQTPVYIPESEFPFKITLIRFDFNHGKKRYYEVISFAFQLLRQKDFDYCWQLPDDVLIGEDYFTRSKELWESIDDEKKICLSTGHTNGRHLQPCWTQFRPQVIGNVVKTQWNDLCYLAPRRFFETLEWDIEKVNDARWQDNKTLGSGVGAGISRKLQRLGFNMYHAYESLVEFVNCPTVMQG